MNLSFIAIVLIIGISGITAQVLLLRELLVSFYGNELTIGIILANWTIAEALGAFAFGKFIEKLKDKISLFVGLQLIFSVLLPFALYFSRTFKGLLNVHFGELIGLNTIFWASLWILLPIAFCHGALFSVSCQIYSMFRKRLSNPIGRIYAWETIGTIIGGVILTCFFIPKINSFQTSFVILAANIACCFILFKGLSKSVKVMVSLTTIVTLVFIASSGVYNLQQDSISDQWKGQMVLDYANSGD